jgi:hypothetical protein
MIGIPLGLLIGVVSGVVVWISPISMRWWPFPGSTLGSLILADLVSASTTI